MRQAPDGMKVKSFIMLGERQFPMTPEKTAIILEDPLWLLSGATLYPVQTGTGLVETLLDNPDLTDSARRNGICFWIGTCCRWPSALP